MRQEEKIGEPFECMEALWFWFIAANEAMKEGARFSAGQSAVQRPCEPIDVIRIMERMHRNRQMTMDHFRVLRFYGLRRVAPDRHHQKEGRAWKIWKDALKKMQPIFERKGIVRKKEKQCWFELKSKNTANDHTLEFMEGAFS